MAQKITVALHDDLDGGIADETMRFGFGGIDYEIDLSKRNADAFRDQIAPYVEHARKAGKAKSGRPRRTASSRQRSEAIRAWAKAQGLDVSDRGRMPVGVVDKYNAAY